MTHYCLCENNKDTRGFNRIRTVMETISDEWDCSILQCPICKTKVEESG